MNGHGAAQLGTREHRGQVGGLSFGSIDDACDLERADGIEIQRLLPGDPRDERHLRFRIGAHDHALAVPGEERHVGVVGRGVVADGHADIDTADVRRLAFVVQRDVELARAGRGTNDGQT